MVVLSGMVKIVIDESKHDVTNEAFVPGYVVAAKGAEGSLVFYSTHNQDTVLEISADSMTKLFDYLAKDFNFLDYLEAEKEDLNRIKEFLEKNIEIYQDLVKLISERS